MKKKFYIFLDIDGVFMHQSDFEKRDHVLTNDLFMEFDPRCVSAFNYLIKRLNELFNTEVIITSAWQYHKRELSAKILKYKVKLENFDYLKDCDKVGRGKSIKSFLKAKKDGFGYLVIEDDISDFYNFVELENIILTNFYEGGLTRELVDEFLESDYFRKLAMDAIYISDEKEI